MLTLPLSTLSLLLTLTVAQPPRHPTLPSDDDSLPLLNFKSKADLNNRLPYTPQTRSNFCHWLGTKCVRNRLVRLDLQSTGLLGTVPVDSLNPLDRLRVLSLRNNSLSGYLPDLSGLVSLRTLFLDRNMFSGSVPASLFSLKTILFIDLSRNNLSGKVPSLIAGLDLLTYLRLDFNRFAGPLPPLNQTYLKTFDVSNNDFSGRVPVTRTLSRFRASSFANNPKLCGVIVGVECRAGSAAPPFFGSGGSVAAATSPSPTVPGPPPTAHRFLHRHRRVGVVLGIVLGVLVLITAFLCLIAFCKSLKSKREPPIFVSEQSEHRAANIASSGTKIKKSEKNNLVFCEEDEEKAGYNLDQLMRASAELLGRGTIGTTYKAVMDGRIVVSVKRLDSGKMAEGVVFEGHMELVGGLRHPNLVPVKAYFQAKEERLIVYDYQPNGSLFNLIHGSRSRAKPLHWTSCLKIADDVAQGLAYIHQASCLVHGNVKSTNVLVGADFEACLTDYCLSNLTDLSSITYDLDSQRYRAPEIRASTHVPTSKTDVHAFGVLLLELVTGKLPSQHPYLNPMDMPDWVRAMRDDDMEEDDRLRMLVEVASVCSVKSPEQRPSMRQVLKMIQDIKERVVVEDDTRNDGYSAY